MAEGKKSFIVYVSWKRWLDGLTEEQKGQWLSWMMDYCSDLNPKYPTDQAVMIACMMAQDTLKRDLKKYQEQCERTNRINEERKRKKEEQERNEINTKSQRSRNEVVCDNDNDNDNVNDNDNEKEVSKDTIKESVKEKSPTSRFVPPTIEQIRDYCIERNNLVDPERFYNFYQAKGWMVGKNKMKDWKAAVRTWEKDSGFKTQTLDDGTYKGFTFVDGIYYEGGFRAEIVPPDVRLHFEGGK